MNSGIALKIYALAKNGTIKSNAMFWKSFSIEKMSNLKIDTKSNEKELNEKNLHLICAFDDDFPIISTNLKNSEKPFLFVYKGDIKLLNQIESNVAVVGVLTPNEDIKQREENIVRELVKNNTTIVSGLAKGCDTVAHKTCINNKGKTIAILPTTFDNIYPKENINLIDKIVDCGGLVITEYVNESTNKYERIYRFVFRDRLQALFSKAVVLVASYTQGNGDSGSRHAMLKAKEYDKTRYVMLNELTDSNQKIFELNEQEIKNGAKILTPLTIKELTK